MSEWVEHRATIDGPGMDHDGWMPWCDCGWQRAIYHTREEAVSAYQSHVYAAMGREASELLAEVSQEPLRFNATTLPFDLQAKVTDFLARQRAALEVEGA